MNILRIFVPAGLGLLLLLGTGCTTQTSNRPTRNSALVAPKTAFGSGTGNQYRTRTRTSGTSNSQASTSSTSASAPASSAKNNSMSRPAPGSITRVRSSGLGGPEALAPAPGNPLLDTKIFIGRDPYHRRNTIEFRAEPGFYYTVMVKAKGNPNVPWSPLPNAVNIRGDGQTHTFTDRHRAHMLRRYLPLVTKEKIDPSAAGSRARAKTASSWRQN